MKLSGWSRAELSERLGSTGLTLHTGPFATRIRTGIPAVIDGIVLLYADYPVGQDEDFADFHVALRQPHGLRHWVRPQVNFHFDGVTPFKPLPLAQALPLLEWGLNWCIGNHAHQFLLIHAAAIEKDGRAAILPGPPGAGKSTLTAFLVYSGWRLLSDELALLSLDDGSVSALARPISLKNRSIDLIARCFPEAAVSARCEDTAKGAVALLKAPGESVERSAEPARPAWIIFPRYKDGSDGRLSARSKATTLIDIGHNAFNYSVHGRRGFDLLSQLVDSCACFDFTYGDLEQALAAFDALAPATTVSRAATA